MQNLTSATKDKGAAQVEHLSCLAAVSSMMLGLVSGGSPEECAELYHYWWEVAVSRARHELVSVSGPLMDASKFASLPLLDLYPDSLPARTFCGALSPHVKVDASHARLNDLLPRTFVTIEDLIINTPQDELLNNVWRAPAGYVGVDCLAFYLCTHGAPGGPSKGQLVCVAVNNKDSSPTASTPVDLKDVTKAYESLAKSFGASWVEWSQRVALVLVANRDIVTHVKDFQASCAVSRTRVCLRHDMPKLYGQALSNLYAAWPLLFGGVKASRARTGW